MNKIIAFLILCLFAISAHAQNLNVEGVRVWSAPDHSRLVFDVSGPVQYKLFTLDNPDRVVIDFKNASLRGKLATPASEDLYLKKIRYAKRNQSDFRVVLDLKNKAKPNTFLLKPNDQYGHRVVVDLEGKASEQNIGEQNTVAQKQSSDTKQQSATKPAAEPAKKPQRVTKSVNDRTELRDIVIAIDAGHGGEDPGAAGPRGTKEKVVVYQIAKELEAILGKEKGFKPILTRRGDYYVGLRNRMKIARKYKADLFISIHADAFRDPRVKGSSVYVLSSRGASNEAARWLADRENAADLVGGVKLEDKDDMLASVLLDLSQTATRQASMQAAKNVFSELKRHGKTHGKHVLKAGFMVLKSPDVPSMLVETAFISNPTEEKNLNSKAHRKKVANAIMNGVKNYFEQSAPPGTWIASRSPKKHVIVSGDTLSDIAQQYSVSMNTLRKTNGIKGDRLRVGQVLTIPSS